MKEKYLKIKKFLTSDIQTMYIDDIPNPKRNLIKLLQILLLAIRGFNQDKLNVRASALTYFTMLSIVPVLALGFGIAKGFGLDAVLENELAKNLAGQKDALDYILKFTRSMLNTAKGGIVAGVGLLVLLWSVMKLLSNIEDSFNMVWEVTKSRSFVRKFTDYIAIVIFAPVLMIISSGIPIFITTQISKLSDNFIFDFITPATFEILKFFPFFIIWFLFTTLYMIMPNTKVKFKPALTGGIIAGTIFQIIQVLYVFFQTGAIRINAIYGSFAALPLFLIWLQISWFVVLLGTEISFAVQNVKLKGSEIKDRKLSISYQKKLALLIMKNLIDDFSKGKKAPTSHILAGRIKAPIHTIEYVLNNMADAEIISKIINKKKKYTYQPAQSINNINFTEVMNLYEELGEDNTKFIINEDLEKINKIYKILREHNSKAKDNILLKDIKNEQ